VRGRLRSADGFTLIELLTVMVLLGIILGSVVTSFSSAFAGETRAFAQAQAEENARMALNRIRLDIHCSTGVKGLNANANGGWTITLGESNTVDQCAQLTLAPGSSGVQWCTIRVSPNRWRLYRENGLVACNGVNSKFMGDNLVLPNPWSSVACVPGRAGALGVQFYVNITPGKPQNGYTLRDEIALRNTTRLAVCNA